ncbi:MAG: type II toxin-antitoxin system HicA family toxin [Methanospirillaceae archaeon]|nr:type II toxin-antitoxin system HicA family toxin [Methanospirillaceae archaeon]
MLIRKKAVRVLTHLGFVLKRQRGSHLIMQHPDGRTTVVPIHSDEDIQRGLLMAIIHDIGIEKDEFISLLNQV